MGMGVQISPLTVGVLSSAAWKRLSAARKMMCRLACVMSTVFPFQAALAGCSLRTLRTLGTLCTLSALRALSTLGTVARDVDTRDADSDPNALLRDFDDAAGFA